MRSTKLESTSSAVAPWNGVLLLADHGARHRYGKDVPRGCAMKTQGSHCGGDSDVHRLRLAAHLPPISVMLCALHWVALEKLVRARGRAA